MIFQNLSYFFVLTILALLTKVNAVNNKEQDAKCLLPMEPGPCRMSLSRFYYNAQTNLCEEFKFGGCKGNDNKFGFKQTCEEACKKSVLPAAAAATTEKFHPNQKQLNANTMKTLTSVIDGSTTTTTSKPKPSRTTVKSRTSTPRTNKSTTTQKSKTQI